MSSALFPEGKSFIRFSKEVASVAGGSNEALVLHVIHDWCEYNKEKNQNFRDGRYWVYNSMTAWREEFDWIGEKALDGAFKRLRDKGLLITGKFNKLSYDKTLWYSVDYERLDQLLRQRGFRGTDYPKMGESNTPICENGEPQFREMETPETGEPIPTDNQQTYNPIEKLRRIHEKRGVGNKGATPPPTATPLHPEPPPHEKALDSIFPGILPTQTSKETSAPAALELQASSRFTVDHIPRDVSDFIFWYMNDAYPEYFNCEHPKIRAEYKRRAGDDITAFATENGVDQDGLKLMARDFFEDENIQGDYSIALFSVPEVLKIRYYNVIY